MAYVEARVTSAPAVVEFAMPRALFGALISRTRSPAWTFGSAWLMCTCSSCLRRSLRYRKRAAHCLQPYGLCAGESCAPLICLVKSQRLSQRRLQCGHRYVPVDFFRRVDGCCGPVVSLHLRSPDGMCAREMFMRDLDRKGSSALLSSLCQPTALVATVRTAPKLYDCCKG